MKPLHLITGKDALRPVFQHFQLRGNKVYVTDGNVAAILGAEEVFAPQPESRDSFPAISTEETLYFNAEDWKRSKAEKAAYMKREGNRFIMLDKVFREIGTLVALTEKEFTDKAGRFPDVPVVFPKEGKGAPVQRISFNPELLANVKKACGFKVPIIEFFGVDKALLIHEARDEKGHRPDITAVVYPLFAKYEDLK